MAGESLVVAVLSRAMVAGTPLLFGTIGEIYAERSGVMNLGVEGMMAVGAVAGFATASLTHSPWAGFIAAMAAGAVLALIHAFFTISLKANQIVSGLALTTLGIGLSTLFGKSLIGQQLPVKFQDVIIPGLVSIPYLGPILGQRDPLFYVAVLFGFLAWFFLYFTRTGLALQATGENPLAVESMGHNVCLIRYGCVLFGGAMAGAAGAHLSLAYVSAWIEGMTAGRGWIVIALTIFSLWNPRRAFLGAFLFGGIEVAQFFVQSEGISPQILKMLPYLGTLLALMAGVIFSKNFRIAAPASLGTAYEKGSR